MDAERQIEELSQQLEKLQVENNRLAIEKIQQLVNYLIQNDFNQLVNFLYRIDVDEKKLKKLLDDNRSTDAAIIITDLLIERQTEKINAKNSFKKQDDIPENEKW